MIVKKTIYIPIKVEIDTKFCKEVFKRTDKQILKRIISDLSSTTFSTSAGGYWYGKKKCRVSDIRIR